MPQATYMEVDPRRDYSFRVPRPDLSVKLGTPNACTRCHLRDERLPWEKGEDSGFRVQGSGDLKEYADWLAAARRGDAAVKGRLEHVDRWADSALDVMYGKNRKKEPHFAEALHAAREMSPDAPTRLRDLLANRNQPAVA